MPELTRYTDEQARERLHGELAQWTVSDGHLVRGFRCNGWRASMLLANGIAHLAEITWHHPDLRVTWGGVEVSLRTHSEDAITDKDFELAGMVEHFANWSPGPGSALDGPPGDGAWRYVEHD